jgi:hypothetical protein
MGIEWQPKSPLTPIIPITESNLHIHWDEPVDRSADTGQGISFGRHDTQNRLGSAQRGSAKIQSQDLPVPPV